MAHSARSRSASARPKSATCWRRSACCSASRRRWPSKVDGELAPGVTAKDLISRSSARSASAAAPGHVIEYRGEAIRALSMDERMTVCNMSIEARRARRHDRAGRDDVRVSATAGRVRPQGADWDARARALAAIAARCGRRVSTGRSTIEAAATRADDHLRHESGHGRSPIGEPHPAIAATTSSLKALRLHGLRRRASRMAGQAGRRRLHRQLHQLAALRPARSCGGVLRGRRIAAACACWWCPARSRSSAKRRREGSTAYSRDAGAEWRESGCSMCIGMNGDTVGRGPVLSSVPAIATSKADRARARARCWRAR